MLSFAGWLKPATPDFSKSVAQVEISFSTISPHQNPDCTSASVQDRNRSPQRPRSLAKTSATKQTPSKKYGANNVFRGTAAETWTEKERDERKRSNACGDGHLAHEEAGKAGTNDRATSTRCVPSFFASEAGPATIASDMALPPVHFCFAEAIGARLVCHQDRSTLGS
jgi:hypothetical protein